MWDLMIAITEAEAAAYAMLEAIERARGELKRQAKGGQSSTWSSTMSSTSPG